MLAGFGRVGGWVGGCVWGVGEAEGRVGMKLDREAESFFLFGRLFFERRRMKLMLSPEKECAHLALETLRYRGGISKACGHGLYKATKSF